VVTARSPAVSSSLLGSTGKWKRLKSIGRTQLLKRDKRISLEVDRLQPSDLGEIEEPDDELIDVSSFSQDFIIDVLSLTAVGAEGFMDLMFILQQYARPGSSGTFTATFAAIITFMSTLLYLMPPGKTPFAMLWEDKQSYAKVKAWVAANAKLASRADPNLRTRADFCTWLQSAHGRCRPPWIPEYPERLDGWDNWDNFLNSLATELSKRQREVPHFTLTPMHLTASVLSELEEIAADEVGVEVGEHDARSHQPGWLCGQRPTNDWDADFLMTADTDGDTRPLMYGRPTFFIHMLMTLLQLRPVLEGIIAWRNIRLLKCKHGEATSWQRHACRGAVLGALVGLLYGLSYPDGGLLYPISGAIFGALALGGAGILFAFKCGSKPKLVRADEFKKVRADFERIMLREGVFEALPQATLEFQNLWSDAWGVLDISAVPFFPFPYMTFLSEYQVTYLLIIVTLLTSTLDIMFCYPPTELFTSACLYFGAMIHLTSRLLLFSTVISIEPEGQKTSWGIATVIIFFLVSWVLTMVLQHMLNHLQLYHNGSMHGADGKGLGRFPRAGMRGGGGMKALASKVLPTDAGGSSPMQITVRWLLGSERNTEKEELEEFDLLVDTAATVAAVEEQIYEKLEAATGTILRPDQQFLTHKNVKLRGDHTMADHGINAHAEVKRVADGLSGPGRFPTLYLTRKDHVFRVEVSLIVQEGLDISQVPGDLGITVCFKDKDGNPLSRPEDPRPWVEVFMPYCNAQLCQNKVLTSVIKNTQLLPFNPERYEDLAQIGVTVSAENEHYSSMVLIHNVHICELRHGEQQSRDKFEIMQLASQALGTPLVVKKSVQKVGFLKSKDLQVMTRHAPPLQNPVQREGPSLFRRRRTSASATRHQSTTGSSSAS
jgi:hypothetical protein